MTMTPAEIHAEITAQREREACPVARENRALREQLCHWLMWRHVVTGQGVLKIFQVAISLRPAPSGDGARASARFNVQKHEARKMPRSLELCALKRRERRAPSAPNACHAVTPA